MKVRALRQAIAQADDDWEIHFLSNDGAEFRLGAALEIPDEMIMFFGETSDGLVDALDDLDNMDGDEWSERLAWLSTLEDYDEFVAADDDEEPSDADFAGGAVEGGRVYLDSPVCNLPEPELVSETLAAEAL
jgi:hypothetical protein